MARELPGTRQVAHIDDAGNDVERKQWIRRGSEANGDGGGCGYYGAVGVGPHRGDRGGAHACAGATPLPDARPEVIDATEGMLEVHFN